MTEIERAQLAQMQPTIEVLRVLVAALGAFDATRMPTFAQTLRAGATHPAIGFAAKATLIDLADGIDIITRVPTVDLSRKPPR